MRILIIEDQKYIADSIAHIFTKNNYSVDVAYDGEYGIDCALSNIYDVIILDLMLPYIDGISILKEIRKTGNQTRVIILTAKDQIEDKINGLDSGADDYLAKPFDVNELLARIKALTRRNISLNIDELMMFENLKLNPHTLTLSFFDNEIRLTLKESQILELLINNNKLCLSKNQIIEKIWGFDSDADDSRVEAQMSLLRKKIGLITLEYYIKTIRGVGYTLKKRDNPHV